MIIVILKSLLMEKILHLWVSLPAFRWFTRHWMRVWKIPKSLEGYRALPLGPTPPSKQVMGQLPLHVNAQNKGEGLRGEMGLGLRVLAFSWVHSPISIGGNKVVIPETTCRLYLHWTIMDSTLFSDALPHTSCKTQVWQQTHSNKTQQISDTTLDSFLIHYKTCTAHDERPLNCAHVFIWLARLCSRSSMEFIVHAELNRASKASLWPHTPSHTRWPCASVCNCLAVWLADYLKRACLAEWLA